MKTKRDRTLPESLAFTEGAARYQVDALGRLDRLTRAQKSQLEVCTQIVQWCQSTRDALSRGAYLEAVDWSFGVGALLAQTAAGRTRSKTTRAGGIARAAQQRENAQRNHKLVSDYVRRFQQSDELQSDHRTASSYIAKKLNMHPKSAARLLRKLKAQPPR